ncbi:MAG: hypothetical protein KatS3mg104_2688 [Phycisphaerae bacterium]|nr:MAG: hypothetical protein KatS3mg104_2688 [Phycisphaerae bacterium]
MSYRSLVILLLMNAGWTVAEPPDPTSTPPTTRPSDLSVTDLLARADQAFANADYLTAVAIWTHLDGQIPQDRSAAIKERMRFAVKQMSLMKDRGIDPSSRRPETQTFPPATNSTTRTSRTPHRKPPDGQVLELSLSDLGNFEFDETRDTSLPDDVIALSGSLFRTTGYMIPLDQVGKVTRFLLVNDLMSCCFGQVPKLQHVMYVNLPEGRWVEPTSERLQVEGTLTVGIRKEDGYVIGLFEMTPSSIKYAPQ